MTCQPLSKLQQIRTVISDKNEQYTFSPFLYHSFFVFLKSLFWAADHWERSSFVQNLFTANCVPVFFRNRFDAFYLTVLCTIRAESQTQSTNVVAYTDVGVNFKSICHGIHKLIESVKSYDNLLKHWPTMGVACSSKTCYGRC